MTEKELKRSAYDMLYLAACAINGIMPETERIDIINIDNLYSVSEYHSMTAISAMALESAGVALSDKWQEIKAKAIRKNLLLDAERAQILDYMEKSGIWYMPLKGIIMKELYPKIGMRQMADNDILYDSNFQKQLNEYMESRGYTTESIGRGAHDTYHKSPVYNFELHTKLYSEFSDKNIHDYYIDIKKRLIKDTNNDYGFHFTEEDFYIFMTAHEYKHYSGGGTGLRSLLDCFVYIKATGDKLNLEYINAELKKLGIDEFEHKSRALAMKVFSSPTMPELTDDEREMLEYYLLSGTYGTIKNNIENNMDKLAAKTGSRSKFRYLMSRLFPSPEFFKETAPFFYRHKILLPVGWIYRAFRGIIVNGKKIRSEIRIVRNKKW